MYNFHYLIFIYKFKRIGFFLYAVLHIFMWDHTPFQTTEQNSLQENNSN
jgi:hypothetical protein